MKNKKTIILLIYIIFMVISPIVQSDGFVPYDEVSFGGKLIVSGEADVITNTSSNISFDSVTLNGYLNRTDELDTEVYFQYGETIAYGNTAKLEELNITLGRSDITDNGWVWYLSPTYGRNATGQTKILTGRYIGIINRGFVEWDISSIPDQANIDNIRFLYNGFNDNAKSYIYEVTNRPSTTFPDYTTLYNDFGSGCVYVVPPLFPTSSTNQSITLNALAITKLQNMLDDDWFAIAFKIDTELGIRYNQILSKASVTAYPYPSLYVEYNFSVLDSPSEFSAPVTGLKPDTTYHYRAVAENDAGTVYGDDMTFHTKSPLYDSPNITYIEETSAVPTSELLYDAGETTTCGFWLGNVSVNSINYEKNISAGTYTEGQTFDKIGESLISGEYYYVRSWMSNSQGFWNSTNESYFLTKPNTPSSPYINRSTSTSIFLRWTNTSVGDGTNLSTLIKYSTSSPGGAADVSWGTLGYNGTGNWTEITGLNVDTTYHFALWSYINATGSPFLWHFSDGYVTTFNATTGGNYTIYVRFENESNGRNPLVNLSKYGPHKILVHSTNEVDIITFDNGIHSSTLSDADFSSNSSGEFSITTDKSIEYIEFLWNNTDTEAYRCRRSLIPESEQRNITFYIITGMPVYGESETRVSHVDYEPVLNPANPVTVTTSYQLDEIISVYIYNDTLYGGWISVANDNYSVSGNQVEIVSDVLSDNITTARVDYYSFELIAGVDVLENSLVRYTYDYIDETNLYTVPNGAYAEIYCYNSSGEKLIIDSEFFDTSQRTYPWLIYDKKYYIGVHCTEESRERLGFAPNNDNLNPEVLIPYQSTVPYTLFDLVDFTIGWYDTGFYVDYLDTTGATVWVNFTVYGYYNHTVINYENITGISNYNFTFDCNTSNAYFWNIICEIDSSNDDYDGIYSTGSKTVVIIPGITPIINAKSINDIFNETLGPSPFYNVDDPSQFVPWVYLIVFGIAFMFLTTTAKANAALGTLGTGLILIFAGAFISGMQFLYQAINGANAVFLIAIGIFLVALAIVASLGGEDNR